MEHTGSRKGKEVLEHFDVYLPKFKKIIPGDYKRMVELTIRFEEQGLNREEAGIEAFYASVGKNEKQGLHA